MASKTMKASIVIGGSLSGAFRSAMSSTKNGLAAIGKEIAGVERKQRLMARGIETFGRQGRNVDGLRKQYAELTREAERLRAAQSRLADVSDRIERNNARRQQLGSQLRGATATFAAGAAAVVLPTMKAAEFNRENQLIGNTANMTRGEVAALGQTILAVSRDTNQAAADVQRGIGFLVAAGLDANRAQASIVTIGRTATAAGADIEDLANASFTLIDSLKIKPEGLQDALDILATAGKEGNVELKDMAKTLPQLGSSFAALKMEGREAAATLGAALEVARKGAGNADEAANNMRNFMAKVMAPDTLKRARKGFGLDLYKIITDAQTTGGNPFEAAMASIIKATAGDQKKIGELFGDMQVQNFIRPMIQNWDEYARIKDKALSGSAGTTDRDFEEMMSTTAERVRGLRNSATRLGLTFGTVIAPSIGSATASMTAFLDTTSGFIEKHPRMVKGVVGAALALTGLRVAALGAAYGWTLLKMPVLATMGFIARWKATGAIAALGRFGPAAARIATTFRAVGTAIAAIGGGPIAIAVAAITAGALLVRKYWEPIKAFLGGMFQGVREAVGPAMAELGAALAPLKPAWDAIAGAVGGAWDWMMKLLAPVTLTSEQFDKAQGAGVRFGRAVGSIIGFVARVIAKVVDGIRFIVNNAGRVGAVMSGLPGVGPIAGMLANTARPGGAQGARMPAPARAQVQAVAASAPVPAASVNRTQNMTFNVTQKPGQDVRDLAREIRREIQRLEWVDNRGSNKDSPQ